MNKLYDKIPNKPINTRGLKLGSIDYKDMMSNVNNVCPKEVADLYDELNKKYRYMINSKDEYQDNMRYVACTLRAEFAKLGYSDDLIANFLVYYLYKNNKRHKQLLWFCYGWYVVENIKRNVVITKTKLVQCIDCGEWFEVSVTNRRARRCKECQHEKELNYMRNFVTEMRQK